MRGGKWQLQAATYPSPVVSHHCPHVGNPSRGIFPSCTLHYTTCMYVHQGWKKAPPQKKKKINK